MLVRRLPILALLAGLPILLANCGSDSPTPGGSAGSPATAGTSPVGTAGQAPVGSGGAGAGGSAAAVAGGGGTSVAGSSTGGSSTGGSTSNGGSSTSGGSTSGGASGSSSGGAAGKGGSGTGGGSTGGTFKLTSEGFMEGGMIPVDATCAVTPSSTKPLMPQLAWTGVPAGTKSFVLTFIDNTRLTSSVAQASHYAMYNIPADVTSIAKGLPAGSPPAGIANMVGSTQKGALSAAYLGPCPNNSGTAADTYAFTLYALSQDKLPGNPTDVNGIVTAAKAATPLGTAILTGTSDAKGTLR